MMSYERIRKQIFINSGTMAASRLVSAAFALLTVPMIVSKLGVIGFGTWEAIFSAASLGAMAQSATINTLLWQLSNAYGAQNEKKAHRLLRLGIFITLLQFIIIVPIVWVFRQGIITLFKVPPSMVSIAVYVLPTYCGMVILNGAIECIGALISGYQHTGKVTMVQTMAQILNYTITITCLMIGFGFVSMLIGFLFAYVFTGSAYYIVAKKYCKNLSLLPAIPKKQEFNELYGYFSLMMIGSCSGVLRDQKDKLVLTTFVSPEWTGYYSIASRLIGFITLMHSFFYIPVVTAVGAINARGNWDGIKRIYGNVVMVIAVTVGCMSVIIAGLHDQIVELWIGESLPFVGEIIIWLLVGNVVAIMLTGPGTAVCKGIGRPDIEAKYWIIGLILNGVFTLILLETNGAIGSIAASALSWVVSSIVFVWILHVQIDLPKKSSWTAVKSLFAIVLSAFIIQIVAKKYPFGTARLDLLTGVAIYGSIALACYFILLTMMSVVKIRMQSIIKIIKFNK